jgi:hypothetical protein
LTTAIIVPAIHGLSSRATEKMILLQTEVPVATKLVILARETNVSPSGITDGSDDGARTKKDSGLKQKSVTSDCDGQLAQKKVRARKFLLTFLLSTRNILWQSSCPFKQLGVLGTKGPNKPSREKVSKLNRRQHNASKEKARKESRKEGEEVVSASASSRSGPP